MEIRPGDPISFEKDGFLYTDIVTGWHYASAKPEIVQRLSRWQWITRQLTPKRFRRSLVIRSAEPETVTITFAGKEDPLKQLHQKLADINSSLRELQ